MFWTIVTLGLFARSLFIIWKGCTWKDPLIVVGALIGTFAIWVSAAERAGIDSSVSLYYDNTYWIPIMYLAVIAFVYRDKILPIITEGMLLLQGLVALFIFYEFQDSYREVFGPAAAVLLMLLCAYTVTVICICYLDVRVREWLQVTLVLMFLMINVYIGYETTAAFSSGYSSLVGPFWFGFYGFFFLSSALYLVNLPMAALNEGKHSGGTKQYLRYLRTKYVDVDAKIHEVLIVVGLIGLLFLNDYLGFTDWITAVCTVLVLGSVFLAPKQAPVAVLPKQRS